MNNRSALIASFIVILLLGLPSLSTHAQSLNSLDSLRQLVQQNAADSLKHSTNTMPTAQAYLARAKFFNSTEDIIYAYQQLAAINYRLGNTNNSLKYYKLYVIELERLSDIADYQEDEFEKNLFENEIRALNSRIEELEGENTALKENNMEYFMANSKIYLGLRLILAIAVVLLIGWLYLKFRKPPKLAREVNEEIVPQEGLSEILQNTKSDLIRAETELDLADLLVNQMITQPEEYFNTNKSLRKKFLVHYTKGLSSGAGLYLASLKNITNIIAFSVPGYGAAGGLLAEHLYTIFNETIKHLGIQSPELVLNQIEEKIEGLFPAGIPFTGGISIAICTYDNSAKSLTYAGADFSLYQVFQGILTKHKGSTRSLVGSGSGEAFKNETIEVRKGDNFYLSTKGFWSQPGGHDYKPFGEAAFCTALESLNKHHLPEHKSILNKIYLDWKGGNEQQDDMLLFGFSL